MWHRTVRTAVFCVGLLAAGVSVARAEGASSQNQPERGIIVLRNGQIIEGRITRAEGLYVVELSDGQIRIKAADVDLVCGSVEEGYQRKRAAIPVGNVQYHLELAQWCLRQGLLGPAAAELADAVAADPKHPMIGVMQHRLKTAQEPPPTAETTRSSASGPSNDDLDRMIRGLPHGAVETFTQSVQPVLMNHCTSSGCHGPQSETGLRLLRAPAGKSASRRVTQRNLYSALQFIDRENPAASQLLSAASGPHGAARYAIFNEHQALQYKRMVDWANQLAHHPTSEAPATVTPSEFGEPPAWFLSGSGPQPQSQEARKARPQPAAGQSVAARRGGARPAAKAPGEAAPASFNQPADPFDPELFNRRLAPEKRQP
jgi:hypothetical protein